MFNLFKKKPVILYAPVTGKAIDITNVPDQVFASRMMGDGIAFQLSEDTVYAPADATVTMIAGTLHAIGLALSNGAELLIHIGLDTVGLNGEGFKCHVTQGSKVKMGQPLIQIDREFMESKNINLITPMVITNSKDFDFEIQNINNDVIHSQSKLIEFK